MAPVIIFTFSFKMVAAFICLGNHKKALIAIKKCNENIPPGVANWYIAQHYQLIILYHTGSFEEAHKVFYEGFFNHPFEKQYPNTLELWRLHEAFINFLMVIGKIKHKENSTARFRLHKFLNDVPLYSKDKRGSNITILILHILFLLQQEKYSAIIDRVESLKTYTHRYLRRDDTFRSNCFIKMLIQLPAANFHREAVVRKAQPYWKKLLSVPLHKANQAAELEIIPYETLWEFVLDSLDNKFH